MNKLILGKSILGKAAASEMRKKYLMLSNSVTAVSLRSLTFETSVILPFGIEGSVSARVRNTFKIE